GDRRHPAGDGRRVDVQELSRHRARRRRQLPGRAARRPPARGGGADVLAVPDDAALRGGGLRAAGGRAPGAAERHPRREADLSVRRAFPPLLVAALAAAAVYPLFGTGYGVRAMLQIFMWIALAGSWN